MAVAESILSDHPLRLNSKAGVDVWLFQQRAYLWIARSLFIVCLNFIRDLCVGQWHLAAGVQCIGRRVGIHSLHSVQWAVFRSDWMHSMDVKKVVWSVSSSCSDEKYLGHALGRKGNKEGLHVAEPALFFCALRASQFHAKIMVIPATSGGLMTTRPPSYLV